MLGWNATEASDTAELRYSTVKFDDQELVGIMDASEFHPEDLPARWQISFWADDVDSLLSLAETYGGAVIEDAKQSRNNRAAVLVGPSGTHLKVMAQSA